jgi:DnaJ like chaperone protein
MSWFTKHKDSEQERGRVQAEGSPFGLSKEEQLQKQIFVSTFTMLSKLASSDGTVSKKEAIAVDSFMKKVLELDEARRKFAISVFNSARKSPTTFEECAKQYRELLHDKPRMFEWMVDVLFRLSYADRMISQQEEELLRKACEIFGISEQRYRQIRSRHVEEGDDIRYEILGCTRESTNEEIESKFQQMNNEYCPDRVRELGLPEEFIKLAEEKHQVITETYQAIRRARGLA